MSDSGGGGGGGAGMWGSEGGEQYVHPSHLLLLDLRRASTVVKL